MSEPLLLEIGCEEIPARMIAAAAEDLRGRVVGILDQAGIAHGGSLAWGGTRRLAVRVEAAAPSTAGGDEVVLGPPVSAAFDAAGKPTPAGAGFAKKQGIDPAALQRIETEKGIYAGFRRTSPGQPLEKVLAASLPNAVAGMGFPKTMRWGDGAHRWVRPVHWIVALHGAEALRLEVLGVASGRTSRGHRFLAPGPVALPHADAYVDALRGAHVLVDRAMRRAKLMEELHRAAEAIGGEPVPDEALLHEIEELVEWPGVVAGRFDPSFLELPEAILVTTLRHHQKSFSVRAGAKLLPAFLSVANTDRDPAGHVRRGNEWVVVGRLEDARFFWSEDRKRPLAARVDELSRVTFHKKAGSYRDKTDRVIALAAAIAGKLGAEVVGADVVAAARLAKADLVTGLVGEFPELQGIVGGLLLRAEGAPEAVAAAVADHYRPAGVEDSIPGTEAGCVLAVADRLDTIVGLLRAGETLSGSRDPFGLRRAVGGIFRILAERRWPITMADLFAWSEEDAGFRRFIQERLTNWLLDRGFRANEIEAVRRPAVSPTDFDRWPLPEILDRLEIVRTLRGRSDFAKLVELTKRVDNILVKKPDLPGGDLRHRETHESALALERSYEAARPRILAASEAGDFPAVVDQLGELVGPVAKFFDDVLVLDPKSPAATLWRCDLLAKVRGVITRDFDIRELAGQADAKR